MTVNSERKAVSSKNRRLKQSVLERFNARLLAATLLCESG